MQPWKHETDGLTIRRIGKLSEELAELSKVTSRIIIQGIDGIEPKTGKTNRESLTEEIADVKAQCELCVEQLGLDRDLITERVSKKRKRMEEWEIVLKQGETTAEINMIHHPGVELLSGFVDWVSESKPDTDFNVCMAVAEYLQLNPPPSLDDFKKLLEFNAAEKYRNEILQQARKVKSYTNPSISFDAIPLTALDVEKQTEE